MTVSRDDVVFAFDMNRLFTSGGNTYLHDFGPNAFHFQFGPGAAAPTPQLDGSLSFDGGDYLALPAADLARFYAKMPTREHTWLLKVSNWSGAGGFVFSAAKLTGGLNYGLSLNLLSNTVMRAYQGKGGAGNDVAFYQPAQLTSSFVAALTVETTPRGLMRDATESTSAWVVGAFGTAAFDVAKVPTIGGDLLVSMIVARVGYLCLLRGALSSPDLAIYSRLLAEGTKPWCVR